MAARMEATGAATLTVTPAALVSIAVTPPAPEVALGRTVQLIVLGTFSDLSVADVTSRAFWPAPDSTIATVSSTRLVTSQSVGSARCSRNS
jgi:Big-like domain-containing protein